MARAPRSSARQAWRYIADLWFSGEIPDRFQAACAAVQLSPPQLRALLLLEPDAEQPMRSLAKTWKCDASWVTGIVDGLERCGYAERRVHPSDRRIKVVAITAEGEAAKARALEQLYEPPDSMAALSAAELRQLRDLLAKVHQARAAQQASTVRLRPPA